MHPPRDLAVALADGQLPHDYGSGQAVLSEVPVTAIGRPRFGALDRALGSRLHPCPRGFGRRKTRHAELPEMEKF
jgi:hypothetical protein